MFTMIKISILNSDDIELIGEHIYHGNFISVGTTNSDHILLEQEFALSSFRVCFKIVSEKKIAVHILPGNDFYISNGKKISGTKLHNSNDIISYQNFEIKIREFTYETTKNNKTTENIKSIVDQLEIEFLQAEAR